jgi:NAD(P)H-hydrate epimerase
MENAGGAVAGEAAKMTPKPGSRIVVLCGPGNNGGDGFVAARHLKRAGYDVRLFLLGDRKELTGDAAEMAARWDGPVRRLEPGVTESMHLIVDALFGAGLSRALDGVAAQIVDEVNASGIPVLAVDVPSGLDGTTGEERGAAIRATRTVTFFRKKPAHVLMPGRARCGDTIVADIGIPDRVLDDVAPCARENSPDHWHAAFPWPQLEAHKYARGHAVVVSGPPDSTGAARLGARGALRIGAGLVTVVGTPAAAAVNATQLTAIMVRALAGDEGLADFLFDQRRNAALIGPGAGVSHESALNVLTLLASKAAIVLDADALTSFARTGVEAGEALSFGFTGAKRMDSVSKADLFQGIKGRSAPVVITPHEGEFRRLFPDLAYTSKIERAREAAQTSGAIVVLKGPDTVVASPDGEAVINSNAPATLATAGSGDVLAGFILGLLAQGMPAFEAACAAVWLHGACASLFGPGLIAEDLPEVLPKVLCTLTRSA